MPPIFNDEIGKRDDCCPFTILIKWSEPKLLTSSETKPACSRYSSCMFRIPQTIHKHPNLGNRTKRQLVKGLMMRLRIDILNLCICKFLLALLFLTSSVVDAKAGSPYSSLSDDSVFKYDPEKVETGIVYHYVKSNIDGSRSGQVSLYVAAKDRLESLKWHKGGSEATLVIAKIDWNRFSVSKFENWQLRSGTDPLQRGIFAFDKRDNRVVVATFGENELRAKIVNWPWHSYDFDFASLGFTFRHLVDPKKPFKIGITDIVRTEQGPKLADKGLVEIVYQEDVERNGHACRRYSIDGVGLENKGGILWVRKADGILVDYEIALPDEPGYVSGKLELTGVERMTEEEWKDYKSRAALN